MIDGSYGVVVICNGNEFFGFGLCCSVLGGRNGCFVEGFDFEGVEWIILD